MAAEAEDVVRAKILEEARSLIGTSYSKLDCSHMVHQAYEKAGLEFPYTDTAHYKTILIDKYFTATTEAKAKPGDLILYSGHVGIYDPDGCTTVNSAECQRMGKGASSMRVLSARSGKNLGVEYGQSSWFGSGQYLVWSGFSSNAATQ